MPQLPPNGDIRHHSQGNECIQLALSAQRLKYESALVSESEHKTIHLEIDESFYFTKIQIFLDTNGNVIQFGNGFTW
ncbi:MULTISPECIES: hypothetical protein [Marinomonas]|uniref:Uncharacterized protein n=1 Tax=Marinomonas rhodophyticola TaxID=2992803 RepID=A0ABT3KHN0_9GAMM|nr:hypothetical protein [Marinomonas sp. KJ51-3]MCW4630020.1 hypothetical protein [Marinomonas sp. KJ51-3]